MAHCSICDKTFKTAQSLASHRYVYHKYIKNGPKETKPDLGESKSRQLNINNAACYPKIVKWMCKCILQGDIPITNEQTKLLKPESEILRRIAKARFAQEKKLIHKQIRRHQKRRFCPC